MNIPNIPSTLTLTLDQYTALVYLARIGVQAQSQDQTALEQFLISIEKANSITRYLLWVQWQELDEPVPPTASFPTNWPPNLRRLIQKVNSPVCMNDVTQVLQTYAKNPVSVMVTPDPNALYGWTLLSAFFNGETA